MSGADIKAVCTEAGLFSAERATDEGDESRFHDCEREGILSLVLRCLLARHADDAFRFFIGRTRVHLRASTSSSYLCIIQ